MNIVAPLSRFGNKEYRCEAVVFLRRSEEGKIEEQCMLPSVMPVRMSPWILILKNEKE